MAFSLSKRTFSIISLLIIVLCIFKTEAANGCIQFSNGRCIGCDSSTHLFSGRCYSNIVGCLKYENGATCVECDSSFSVLKDGECQYTLSVQNSFVQEKISQIHLYDGKEGQRYGESNFRPISVQEAQSLRTFQILDNLIRTGEHKHRISSTQNPVFSVYTYIKDDTQSFKIVYDGTGGAVILTIGDVNRNTLEPKIRSITVISIHQIIDYCSLYDDRSRCIRCTDGYHLENGVCYLSVGGCISYRKNICIGCADFYLLMENRCVSDCPSISDCRSALFYGIGTQRSTIEIAYGNSIFQTNESNSQNSGVIVLNTTSRSQNSSSTNSNSNRTTSTTTVTTTTSTTSTTNPDSNCVDYNFDIGRCQKCSPFFFLNKFKRECEAVSPFCQTYSEDDGACLTCYPGFQLDGKECKF